MVVVAGQPRGVSMDIISKMLSASLRAWHAMPRKNSPDTAASYTSKHAKNKPSLTSTAFSPVKIGTLCSRSKALEHCYQILEKSVA